MSTVAGLSSSVLFGLVFSITLAEGAVLLVFLRRRVGRERRGEILTNLGAGLFLLVAGLLATADHPVSEVAAALAAAGACHLAYLWSALSHRP